MISKIRLLTMSITVLTVLVSQDVHAICLGQKTGMGYRILKNGLSLSKQIDQANTIYVIKYDYDLQNSSLTIPANCVLEFEGGSICNGTIIANNTVIDASAVRIFNIETYLEGTWNVTYWYPEWFGAIGDGQTDDTQALQKLNGKSILLSNKTYLCTNLVYGSYTCIFGINKFNSCIKQKDFSSGDFIRLEDWFGGTISDIRIEGGASIKSDKSLWMQSLLKIVNYTYKHNPQAPGEYNGQDILTYYSSINNVVIRRSSFSGLSVLGYGNTDKGKSVEHNWIHKITNIWIEQCAEYGIYDCATDNQWSNINVSRCGYSNLYIAGSTELFSNVKLDGESGYKLEGKSSEKILRDRYNGAGLVLIGGNNTITGLDIQSILYKGLVIDSSRNLLIGSINNIGLGFSNSAKDQRNCPAIYFYGQKDIDSNTLIINVYNNSDSVGTCVIRHSTDMSKINNNNINISFKPHNNNYKGAYYKAFVEDMKELKMKDNIVTLPSNIK